jgi:hypothetical protein
MAIRIRVIEGCRWDASEAEAKQAGRELALRYLGERNGVEFRRADDDSARWHVIFGGAENRADDVLAQAFADVMDGRVALDDDEEDAETPAYPSG